MPTARQLPPLAVASLQRRVRQALGHEPADLVVRDVRLVDVATGTVRACDIAIADDTIVALGERFAGRTVVDGGGRYAAPGFIDAHVHVESSMVTPPEFERGVLVRGTTTAICDPHEIANVLGNQGIRYFLDASERLRMTLLVNLSACVPATDLETAGARLEVEDLLSLADHPAVLGLAELMNFPAVLAGDEALLAKVAAFAARHVDGHAPLLRSRGLDAYLAVGVRTDHESTEPEEAREKLEKGAFLLLREGSVAKNVGTLAPLLNDLTWPRIAFCTDDRNPLEIRREGHIDHAMRVAIRAGAPTLAVYRAATLGAATAFGLRDRGVVAPGYRADIVLLDDLDDVAVSDVVCAGRLVGPDMFEQERPPPVGTGSVRRAPVTADAFAIPATGASVPVVGALPFSLITEHLERTLPARDGRLEPDPEQGIMKLCVLERHGRNGNIGRGFVHGFGPLAGAIATSIGHDSHNLIVVGGNDADMAAAINRLIELQGGAVVAAGGEVRAELALPVAGLMSDRGLDEVEAGLLRLKAAAKGIGCRFEEPVLQLAFLPLPVIPHLKLTDRGYVAAGPDGLRLLS